MADDADGDDGAAVVVLAVFGGSTFPSEVLAALRSEEDLR